MGATSVRDFEHNPRNIFTTHEMLGYFDASLATKFTVQFNLYGGTLFQLGTERHAHLIPKIDDLSGIGCFCLSELGYGNNAIEMETTATYDAKAKEFVIHSPSVLSQKYWITNGACHAKWAIVFAQTYVKDVHEGLHVFLVRIRNEDLSVCKGVFIEDMGIKIGQNGIDNARIAFEHVRIPRENMLNKYADVTEDGEFVCSIKKKRNRFLKVADRLISGRVCIASMAISPCKWGLYIALKYSKARLTVGKSGKSDTPIFSY